MSGSMSVVLLACSMPVLMGVTCPPIATEALSVSAESLPRPAQATTLPLLGDQQVHLYAQEAYEGFPSEVQTAVGDRHAELVAAGMDCARHLLDWSQLEPTQGNYNLEDLIEALPPYIVTLLEAGVAWDDPRITGPFVALLDQVVPIMLERGTYMIGFGNELSGYYENEPAAAESVAGFVQAAISRTRAIEPKLACTIVFAGPEDLAIGPLLPLIDVATFNYYFYELVEDGCTLEGFPLMRWHATGPGQVGAQLDALIAAADDKLICIQEIGQATGWDDQPETLGPRAGLSNQQAVLAALARELDRRRDRFRTVSLWTLNDHTREGIGYVGDALEAAGLPGCYADNIDEIFGPTGVVYSDTQATPKPAFEVFKAAITCLKGAGVPCPAPVEVRLPN